LVLQELLALALLVHVLHLRNDGLRGLGPNWRWSDPFMGLGLPALYWVSYAILFAICRQTGLNWETKDYGKLLFGAHIPAIAFVLVTINPFFEELIARAFLISELRSLLGSSAVAISASVILQASYHLYQGLGNATAYALLFFIMSVYYVQKRRI